MYEIYTTILATIRTMLAVITSELRLTYLLTGRHTKSKLGPSGPPGVTMINLRSSLVLTNSAQMYINVTVTCAISKIIKIKQNTDTVKFAIYILTTMYQTKTL